MARVVRVRLRETLVAGISIKREFDFLKSGRIRAGPGGRGFRLVGNKPSTHGREGITPGVNPLRTPLNEARIKRE